MKRPVEHSLTLRVGKYFFLQEFLISHDHPQLIAGYILNEYQILKIHYLCKFLLDPVRETHGSVIIMSGHRTPPLNDAVGGADNSQHLFSEAADFIVPKACALDVWNTMTKTLQFPGELIWYKKESVDRWHCALPHPSVKSDHLIKG